MTTPIPALFSRLVLVALAASLTACSTVRSTLQPWVCDCAQQADATCEVDDSAIAVDQPSDDHEEVEGFSEDEEFDEVAYGDSGEDDPQDAQDAPVLRTLRREAPVDAPEQTTAETEASLQPIDPRIPTAVLDVSSPDARQSVSSSRNVSLPSDNDLIVLAGTFVRGEESTALLLPGRSLRVYHEGSLAAQRRFEHHAPTVDLSELTTEPIIPVQLVRDGSTQVLVHYADQAADGSTRYRVAIYKVIGPEIGTIFEQTLAIRASDDAPLQHVGRYRVLEGKTHRFIEWTPIGADGNPTGAPQILRWNRWEGVYRTPTPPPSSPRRQS